MESPSDLGPGYTVFTGSSERDVLCCKMFWNSVTLQPPLESRLVSGDMHQRKKAAGSPGAKKNEKNYTFQHLLEDIKTECFLLEANKEQNMEQKATYLQKAKRREEIIALLKKQREERIKKEAISRAHRPVTVEKEPSESPSRPDIEATIQQEMREVQQLK
ncbi:cilia- and flagella-associated protein HOATZ [Discoglossus pictus]